MGKIYWGAWGFISKGKTNYLRKGSMKKKI